MTKKTRRRLLTGIGTSLSLAIAGCGGNSGSGNSTGSSSDGSGGEDSDSSVFAGFSFEDYTLNISLATTEGYDQIVAFYDGEKFSDTSVTPSAGKVSLDFSGYEPGTYRFAAINSDNDSVIAEVKQEFVPDIQLVEWETATETGAYTPENKVSIASPVLTVKNAGTAPDEMKWVGYESETYTAEWYPPGEENKTTSISEIWSPESQKESLVNPPTFKSGAEVPVVLHPGERRQFVETYGSIGNGLHSPYSVLENEETAGWSVQQGLEYNVTMTVAAKYSGLSSKMKTVVWEQVAEVESLEKQPESASIVTKDPQNSSS
ncbi:hypothetical protein RBH20_19960 [Haloarcula sp. H-GB4]|uniref:hypothetical protein n=1 Tax=Haloarcula sp. H-GB4 TaxID=3069755 RepID=UPI0027B79499|nr:hypothetical protein [Haloarcula sp. H-GB4]MDQ2074804.1 hypothetical protein [Haloarcula sp. H-GB4]